MRDGKKPLNRRFCRNDKKSFPNKPQSIQGSLPSSSWSRITLTPAMHWPTAAIFLASQWAQPLLQSNSVAEIDAGASMFFLDTNTSMRKFIDHRD